MPLTDYALQQNPVITLLLSLDAGF
ncbi:protein of unknown function [Magnetospirillum sp. XM-1]|nr:protein of unknown function [Magnetospirillum sp. XM-1]